MHFLDERIIGRFADAEAGSTIEVLSVDEAERSEKVFDSIVKLVTSGIGFSIMNLKEGTGWSAPMFWESVC